VKPLNPDPAFWRGRRVFITGHTGFKGSWLSLWLQQLGARITGYALAPPTQPSLFTIAGIATGLDSHLADLRDLHRLREALQAASPEIVLHLAAQALVRQGYADPVATYATNVMGTVNLLEAVRHTPGVRAVVIVTSDKCYENREWVWGYRENEPLGGRDPYSSSKACAELVTHTYRDAFFNPARHAEHGVAIASARAGNVIGGGDWAADRLIPDLLRAIAAGEPAVIRSPQAIRPWQHVLEPLAGYLLLAERLHADGPAFAEAWNFGPHDEDARPVQWLIERLTTAWQAGGGAANWQLDPRPQPHEAHYLKLDCAKSRSQLGWQPRWSLDETIRRIVAWHQAQASGADMRDRSIRELIDYENQPV
jgi:CDP-glucose 4,6-dehydratase